MHFEHPDVFYLLVLPLIALIVKRRKTDYKRYFTKEMFDKVFVNYKSSAFRFALLVGCYILVVLALSRPVSYQGSTGTVNKNIDIVAALDMSKSMTTKDVYPDRFAFAKQKLLDFIKQEQGLNIAVVGYSDFPFLISASTNDKNALTYLVSHTKLKQINSQGTNLLALLKGARQLLSSQKEKVVVIFTDGGHSGLLKRDIYYAKKYNMHIFVYAVASLQGGVMHEGNRILTNVHHQVVVTRLNKNIQKLCKATKGSFFVMSTSSNDIDKLIQNIKARYPSKSHTEQTTKTQELYYIPLGVAIILFLLLFVGERR